MHYLIVSYFSTSHAIPVSNSKSLTSSLHTPSYVPPTLPNPMTDNAAFATIRSTTITTSFFI